MRIRYKGRWEDGMNEAREFRLVDWFECPECGDILQNRKNEMSCVNISCKLCGVRFQRPEGPRQTVEMLGKPQSKFTPGERLAKIAEMLNAWGCGSGKGYGGDTLTECLKLARGDDGK